MVTVLGHGLGDSSLIQDESILIWRSAYTPGKDMNPTILFRAMDN